MFQVTSPNAASVLPRVPGRPGNSEFLQAVRDGLFADVPKGIEQVVAALDKLAELERRPSAGLDAFCDQVISETSAGKPLPDDFAAAALESVQEGDRQQAARMAIVTVREKLDRRLPDVVAQALPGLLGNIRIRVENALKRGREASKALRGLDVTDADEVVEATEEQRKALRAFNAARTEYEAAREAQRLALLGASGNQTRAVGLPKEPEGKRGMAGVVETGVAEFSRVAITSPPRPDLDPRIRFHQVISRGDVWVPDLAQLAGAWAKIRS